MIVREYSPDLRFTVVRLNRTPLAFIGAALEHKHNKTRPVAEPAHAQAVAIAPQVSA